VTVRIRQLGTPDLHGHEMERLRAIMVEAFGDDPDERFTDADWEHALGGRHFLVEDDGVIVGHASVVPRELHVAGHPVRTGYVEAVAIDPARHGQGLGSRLMHDVNEYVVGHFELGALGTARHAFYERLGWLAWRGPTSVRTANGERSTPDEDGYILVLTTPTTPFVPIDLTLPLSCDWRPGDVW
jgi:aminoglycoside 2'-N-acetyltransferase I